MDLKAYQSVIVNDEKLALHGKAGAVVGWKNQTKGGDLYFVKMDCDGEIYDFKLSQLRAL